MVSLFNTTTGLISGTPTNDAVGDHEIEVTATDTSNESVTASFTIAVGNINDAPVANTDTAEVTEDGSVLINAVGNDTDVDSDSLTITDIELIDGSGTAEIVDNQIRFVPSADYNSLAVGETAFAVITYTVSDGNGGTSQSTATVTITGSNDTPTAVVDTVFGDEDAAVITGNVLDNDADPDSTDTLTASLVEGEGPSHGTITVNTDGTFSYTPEDNFNGTDSFTYQVSDGQSGVSTATVTVTVNSVNDTAVISGDTAGTTVDDDTAVSGTLSVSDVDGSDTFVPQTDVAGDNGYGSFSIDAAGNWTFTPNASADSIAVGSNGTETFTVETADGTTQVVSIVITGTADAATISGDTSGTTADDDTAVSGILSVSDVDGSDIFVVQTDVAGDKGYGSFSIDTAGAWTFTPNASADSIAVGNTETETFTVESADGTTQVVSIIITGTNDTPEAVDDTFFTVEDTSISGTVVANDIDIDGDTLSASLGQSGFKR